MLVIIMGIKYIKEIIMSFPHYFCDCGPTSCGIGKKYPAPEQDPQQKVSKEDMIKNIYSEIYKDRVILDGIIARYLGSDSPEEKREMYIKEYDIRERMHNNELMLIRSQNED